MKNSVLKFINMRESTLPEFELSKYFGLTQKKHQATIKAAQEIIHGDTPQPSIQDSLNCGKLRKFLYYLQNGSFCILLWGYYSQQFLSM